MLLTQKDYYSGKHVMVPIGRLIHCLQSGKHVICFSTEYYSLDSNMIYHLSTVDISHDILQAYSVISVIATTFGI
jgi:hypothetical protein